MDSQEIARLIKTAKKSTPVTVYVRGTIQTAVPETVQVYPGTDSCILIGEAGAVLPLLKRNTRTIRYWHIDNDRRYSAIPLLDLTRVPARIEPGAIIRDKVKIGRDCIIMMGAVINIGAVIGAGTMVDMNAVVGARALIGKQCHLGAGCVVAGVLEPPSATPVRIGDHVLLGANSVVLEGVRVGKNSVIAAGAVVTRNIPANRVAAGIPARVLKKRDAQTDMKTALVMDLRHR